MKKMFSRRNPSTDYTEKICVICGWILLFHEGKPHNWHELLRAWSFEPLVVISLIRAVFIGTRPKPDHVDAREPTPAPKPSSEPRRVEPRID